MKERLSAPLPRHRHSEAINGLLRELSDFSLVFFIIITELDCGVDVGRTVDVGVDQHRLHAHKDLLHADDRPPSLVRCLLCVELICPWRVEDRDANPSVRIDYTRGK